MAGPLIAVFSPKGGVGKTLIATGLALHLARRTQSAMLVDLDGDKADIVPLLQIPRQPSLLEYLGDGRAVSHPTGLQVLPGPIRLVDEGLVTGDLAMAVLQKAAADHTVVADLSSSLRDSTVVALEHADAVLLVTTPDLLSVVSVRRFVQDAGLVGIDLSHFRLVINRANTGHEIGESEILELIGLPLAARVPSLPGLAAAVNRAVSGVVARQETDFGVAMREIADQLAFAGISGYARRAAPVQEEHPFGLIRALRRWWNG